MKKFLAAGLLAIAAGMLLPGASATKTGPEEAADALFGAMSKHDAEAARVLFLPEATLTVVKDDGTLSVIPKEKWLERMGTSKDAWLERMWDVRVHERGALAVVWGTYDFHLNGKLSHCGIDSFNMVKSEGKWKIAGILFTSETSGCPASPLGEPAK